jgi:hypothetical protein
VREKNTDRWGMCVLERERDCMRVCVCVCVCVRERERERGGGGGWAKLVSFYVVGRIKGEGRQ